ncbi:hypothetical protein O3M35_005655 [Rhynocoris fuscipes]|uniref:Small-subunit processome Utp12 domain-containing protein n=1 Tax=Rhynocoris fuscipes TaxID=488301 RepID=A0AAW1DIY1_9HEMI
MVKDLYSFSDCGQYFVHCGSEGKLKVWDTVTGNLKQEYSPNLHLNTPCTCLTWVSLSGKFISLNQKRKRKLKGKTTKVIVLGTNEGALAVYSLSEGEIISTLHVASSSSVQGISWSRDAGLFTVDGSNVIHWDLENKTVRSKWKCKGNPTQVAVSPNGELCVTGNININLWEVNSQKCLKTFIGHSNELCSLNFINDNYFLSCGINDRHIATWATNAEEDKPIGRFALGDNLRGEISFLLENKTSLHMVVATINGSLLYFNQQLNGKVNKSIKPAQRVELNASESENATASSKPIPVVCGKLTSSSTVSVAYGYSPLFGFETFSISTEREKQTISVSKPTAKHVKHVISPTNCVGANNAADEVEYTNRLASTASGVKRKLGASNEVTMEERLGNLCIDLKDTPGIAATSTQNSHNLSHLLIQGLDSKDKTILDSVLTKRDPKVIHETVTRLPVHALAPLIQELKRMMHGRTTVTALATEWLKVILREHASQLLADPLIQTYLTSIQSIIDARLNLLGPLGALSGRLGHVLQQLDTDNQGWRNLADSFEPVVLYQDQDSLDEGDSIVDGDYESEDKWDELSDQQVDSEPSS